MRVRLEGCVLPLTKSCWSGDHDCGQCRGYQDCMECSRVCLLLLARSCCVGTGASVGGACWSSKRSFRCKKQLSFPCVRVGFLVPLLILGRHACFMSLASFFRGRDTDH